MSLAEELRKLVADSEAQDKELADLHEQIMRYQADPQYDARFIEGQEKTLAAMKEENSDLSLQVKHYHDARMPEQHSADLREVAEMAIRDMERGLPMGWIEMKGKVDSILAAFREKKAEAGK